MGKGIAFAGNLILDQLKFVKCYPAESTLTTITSVQRSMGGLVCNCSVDIAKLAPDVPVTAIGIVGEDEAGEYIVSGLERYASVDCSGIRCEGTTSFTDVMTASDGTRTFFQFRGANALLGPEHFNFEKLQADILHIGYILLMDRMDEQDTDYPTVLCRVLAEAQRHGIRTSVDVVSEESDRFARIVRPALRYTDYCIVNEIEAGRTTGLPLREGRRLLENNLEPCARQLAQMGVSRWVVIHSPEMSCGLDVATGYFCAEPSWSIPDGFKVSSVGAGDAFACGVLLGAYYGWPLREAIHKAGAIAACSLSGNGASDAIYPLSELLDVMEGLATH